MSSRGGARVTRQPAEHTTTTLVRWSSRARGVLENRFAQFVMIGGAMFALAPASEPRDVVSVDRQTLAALADADTTNGSSVSGEGTRNRVKDIEQRFIEDEVLYREGLRLGFDKDDGIVRQRVVQKVLFLAEEIGGASRPPTDAELRAFHRANPERFVRPARVHFRHIFTHEKGALPPAPAGDQPRGGEVSPIGPEMDADVRDVGEALGGSFAAQLTASQPGTWSTPIQSAYGWHLVRVLSRKEARPASFEEVQGDVAEQYSVFRRQEAIAAYMTKAFSRYRVTIDGESAPPFTPSPRLAMRGVPSAED